MTNNRLPSRIPIGCVPSIALAALVVIIGLAITLWLRSRSASDALPESAAIPTKAPITLLNPAPPPLSLGELSILFQEGFDVDRGGWELSRGGQAVYAGSAIALNDTSYGDFGWARPHLRFQNFILTVDSRWIGGAVGGEYGVRFRLKDEKNFYSFTVRNDSWYAISKAVDGDVEILSEGVNQAINRQGGVNSIQIEANGEHIRYFVNGTYVADMTDGAYPDGDVMLMAQSPGGANAFQVGFDNLIVTFYPE